MSSPGSAESAPGPAPGTSKPFSLRRRLLLVSVIVLGVSLGIVGAALNNAYLRSSEADIARQMETLSYLVLGATEVGPGGMISVQDELGDPRLSQPGSGVYVHVHGENDHWSSPSALGIDLPELDHVPPGEDRFLEANGPGTYYRFQYGVAWEAEDLTVQPFTVSVLVERDIVARQVRSFRRGLWKSLGAAGLLLAAAQLMFFAISLRPLRQVALDVAEIESGRRDKLEGPYPRELEPLTRNLDRLLQTEKANQARYRSALDSLAHSLKTPLAVIRAGLARSDDAEAPAMQEAVDDMQYLIASRLERAAASARKTMSRPVAVLPQVERVVASLRKVYSHNLKTIDVRIDPDLSFYGEERDLLEMAGNLLDNACKYGDGTVCVSAGALRPELERPGLWLSVENGGKPIQADRYSALIQRGVRDDERVEGHGLGLTIVLELVSAYGGDIRIDQGDLGGARFRVSIPPA